MKKIIILLVSVVMIVAVVFNLKKHNEEIEELCI